MIRRGGLLIELLVALSIVGVLAHISLHVVDSLKKARFRNFQDDLVALCHASRHYAMASRSDVILQSRNGRFNAISHTTQIYTVVVPGSVQCQFPKKLGFTETGTVKYSGSIRCQQKKLKFRISLAIGSSRIGVYDA